MDQSCKNQTLLRNGRGIENVFLKFWNRPLKKIDSLIDKIPSAQRGDNLKTSALFKSLNDELVIGWCVKGVPGPYPNIRSVVFLWSLYISELRLLMVEWKWVRHWCQKDHNLEGVLAEGTLRYLIDFWIVFFKVKIGFILH